MLSRVCLVCCNSITSRLSRNKTALQLIMCHILVLIVLNIFSMQVEKSPYLQKLAHTHVVPMQISRPPSATQLGGGFGMSRGRGSRPVSAKPYSATYGGWDSGKVGLKSQYTSPNHSNWDTYNERDRGTFAANEKSGRQKIDPRFIESPNFGDPVSPRAGRRPRPLSAPLCKRSVGVLD